MLFVNGATGRGGGRGGTLLQGHHGKRDAPPRFFLARDMKEKNNNPSLLLLSPLPSSPFFTPPASVLGYLYLYLFFLEGMTGTRRGEGKVKKKGKILKEYMTRWWSLLDGVRQTVLLQYRAEVLLWAPR